MQLKSSGQLVSLGPLHCLPTGLTKIFLLQKFPEAQSESTLHLLPFFNLHSPLIIVCVGTHEGSVDGHAVPVPCISWQIYCVEGQSEFFVHPTTGFGFTVGHDANSQFGPVLPTAEPSGHSFASCVQATCPPAFVTVIVKVFSVASCNVKV